MRKVFAGLTIVVALLATGGCGGTQKQSPATPSAAPPPYRLEIGESPDWLKVFVDKTYPDAALESIVAELQKKYADEPDGYHVYINCATGVTPSSSGHRLANARFAVGPIGAARTGLPEGTREFEPVKGAAKCPPDPLPAAAADAITAQQVVNAFIAAGLPAPDPRDNSANVCDSAGCAQLITTDDVSVYQFADMEAATKWATGIGGYQRELIVLRFNEGGSDPVDPADIPQYQAVLDGLVG